MKNLIKQIVFILLPALAFFLFLEVIATTVSYVKFNVIGFPFNGIKKTTINTKVYELPIDLSTGRFRPGTYKSPYGHTYRINSQGYRGKEFSVEKGDFYRLIAFGGSSTQGLESPDNKTYPALVEQKLLEKKSNIEVLNFGFSGKSLDFIFELLVAEGLKYRPNAIIINSNRNSALYDSYKLLYPAYDIKREPNFAAIKFHYKLMNNWMTYRVAWEILSRILNNNESNINSPFHKWNVNEAYFTKLYYKTLEEIVKIGRANDFLVILVKQPILIEPKTQIELSKLSTGDLLTHLNSDDHLGLDSLEKKFWILTNILLNQQLERLTKYDNVVLVEAADIFLKETNPNRLFFDYVHLTPDGNDLMAKTIVDALTLHFQ